MATHVFNSFLKDLLNAYLVSGADVRVALLMTNTTADTERDSTFQFIDDLSTLDECDGANYVRKALTGEVVTSDDASDEAEFDADDLTWTALGAGSRSIAGILIYKHVSDDTDSRVLWWHEFSPVKTPDGSDFTIQWHAEGLLKAS